jgi:hypothetical protein
MKAKALRLPDNILDAIKFAEKREKLDEPTTIRKFLRMGAEKYVSDSYARGDIGLREAAKVLDMTTREALELFSDMGVSGNVDAAHALKAISFAEKNPRHSRRAGQ